MNDNQIRAELLLFEEHYMVLKSSEFAWRNHLVDILTNDLVLKSSLADPDIWFRLATDRNELENYSYILIYVQNALILDKTPKRLMEMMKKKIH